ncbi:MAG: nitroreductase [Betaproteobacteria bacterium]|nr:nitroreductase [Betaproteobacteria bacterium]
MNTPSTAFSADPASTVEEAAVSRRSVRAYSSEPVPRELIEQILRTAGTAPSGSNTQPWRVYVLRGQALARVSAALSAAFQADEPRRPDYEHYASPLPQPYLARRRACGVGLYSLLGIGRGDTAGTKAYRSHNFSFFGAPVGMVFTIHRSLSIGNWLDYGMFLQTTMLAARGLGLHTCPEGAIAVYPDIIRACLVIPQSELVVCGMALGFADRSAPINQFQPRRCELHEFASFIDD